MIKKILTVIIACMAIAACVSCSSNTKVDQDGNNDGVKVGEDFSKEYFILHVDKDRYVGSSKVEETSDIDVRISRASVTAIDRINKPIKDAICLHLNDAHERHIAVYDTMYNAYVEIINSEEDTSSALFPWHLYVDYDETPVRNDGKVLTIKETVDFYVGSPSVTPVSTFYYNFDVMTGNLIPQILYTEGNDEERDAADALIYGKLVEKYGEETISYDNVMSSFAEESLEAWYFKKDMSGIVIYFNAGKIAPEVAGDFEIEISKSELPEAALAYFID